jgi:hypothetical protein
MYGVSASSMGIQKSHKQRSKKSKFVRALLIVVAVCVVGFIALVVVQLFSHGLQPTTFDNGKGDKFKLQFYGGYKVIHPTGQSDANVLQAPDVKGTGVPLLLVLTHTKPNFNLCGSSTYQAVYTVTMKSSGVNEKVCSLSVDGKPLMYFMQFGQNNGYLAQVMFDLDKNANTSDASKAEAVQQGADLSLYNDDLKVILSSIQVL